MRLKIKLASAWWAPLAAGTTIGGATGAFAGAIAPKRRRPDGSKDTRAGLILRGLLGGASLGLSVGALVTPAPRPSYHYHYDFRGGSRQKYRQSWEGAGWTRPPPQKAPMPDWLKGVKTKAEAKKAYHAQVRKHHPDQFQDASTRKAAEERMKDVNVSWDSVQDHPDFPKTAAFSSELLKIIFGV